MNVNDMFPSKFLHGSDLKGPVTVTIEKIRAESMHKPGVGQVTGYVLYAVNGSRGIVLSRPLALQIAQVVGDPDTNNWIGKKVTLYPESMTVAGTPRVAIRARAAQG